MASSSDELDSHPQPSKSSTRASGASRPVAGAKPNLKRKKGASSNVVGNADTRHDAIHPIAISSDEEARLTSGRRVRAATGAATPTSNGRAVSSKEKGKATVPSKQNAATSFDEDVMDAMVEVVADAEDDVLSDHAKKSTTANGKGKRRDRLPQTERLQQQLKDVTHQRDSLSNQLQELFQLRNTEPEQLLAEQKTQYEARLKAQEDTIRELQNSLTHVDALSQSDGTTSLHFLTRETADQEKQDIQREVVKLRDAIKTKDAQISELNETIRVLRADLKAEIENTKALTSRNPPPSTAKHSNKAAEAKNALAIRLYEELTNLLIINVKHEPGQYKEDDAIYTCVQTSSKGHSLNFTLKFFKDAAEGDTPSGNKRYSGTIEKVVYTPLSLEKEPEEFLVQLDFLAAPFTFPKEQLAVFTKTLNLHLEGPDADDQSSVSQVEEE